MATFQEELNSIFRENRESLFRNNNGQIKIQWRRSGITEDNIDEVIANGGDVNLSWASGGDKIQFVQSALMAGLTIDNQSLSAYQSAGTAALKARRFAALQNIQDTARERALESGNSADLEESGQINDILTHAKDAGTIPKTAEDVVDEFLDTINDPKVQEGIKESDEFTQAQALSVFKKFAPEFADTLTSIFATEAPRIEAVANQLRPQEERIRDLLNQEAIQGLESGGRLSPELDRFVTESIRGAQTARGTGFGNSAVTSEAITKGRFAEEMRRFNLQFADSLLKTNAATQVDPFSILQGTGTVRNPMPNPQTGTGTVVPFTGSQVDQLKSVPFNLQQAQELLDFQRKEAGKDRDLALNLGGVQAGGAIMSAILGGG